jgi:hypothetical protein
MVNFSGRFCGMDVVSELRGSYGNDFEKLCLLGCYAMKSGKSVLIFKESYCWLHSHCHLPVYVTSQLRIHQSLPVVCKWYYPFMFCWPCISKYVCNEANLIHCLFSVYWVTTPLHVGGPGWNGTPWSSIPSRSADSRLRRTTCTNYYIYSLLPPGDRLLASLKHVEL